MLYENSALFLHSSIRDVMKNENRKNFLAILVSGVFMLLAPAFADEPVLDHIYFGDINNIAIGAFNLRENTYLFSIPKDFTPGDRGAIWGEMLVSEYQGKKQPFISFFNCGPVTSHHQPYIIDFSENDKYLVVESGGEGGTMIDVFEVGELFIGPPGKGWNGTDQCVKPVATVGGYRVPVTFHGWKEDLPLVKSAVPLNQITTSADVIKHEKQEECCNGQPRIYAWDIFTYQFNVTEEP